MTNSENPFVLLARITVKEGMVDEYLAIAEAADKAVEKQKRVCCFITLIVILMTNINLSGRRCQNKAPSPIACWILASGPCLIRYLSVISKPALRSSNLQLCCM